MSSKAQYRVKIPTMDALGQPLHHQLPMASHQWLHDQAPRVFGDSWIEGPHDGQNGHHHHLIAIAEENPEADSLVKQLASYVGQCTNHPHISASKHGKGGLESWIVPNKDYQHGVGADPRVLEIERGGQAPSLF